MLLTDTPMPPSRDQNAPFVARLAVKSFRESLARATLRL
jgi:hypothetical protein